MNTTTSISLQSTICSNWCHCLIVLLCFLTTATQTYLDVKTNNDKNNSPTHTNAPAKRETKTVYVGALCGANKYWDPSEKICVTVPDYVTGSGMGLFKQGKPRVSYQSSEISPNSPAPEVQNSTDHKHGSADNHEPVKIKMNPHCGLGYTWSSKDKLCKRQGKKGKS